MSPSSDESPRTAAQAADFLRIGRKRLKAAAVSSRPYEFLRGRRYYRQSDLEAYRAQLASAPNRRAEVASRQFTRYPRWDDAGQSRALSTHPLYDIHRNMVRRSTHPGHHAYDDYGGRGIRVHEPWLDFPTFVADIGAEIGPRPVGRSLDRIHNDRNYEPGNLKWSTPQEQAANRRPRSDFKPSQDGDAVRDCLCDFDCSPPGLCPLDDLPWEQVARDLAAERQRIAELRNAPLPRLVLHVHTGAYVDCFACVR